MTDELGVRGGPQRLHDARARVIFQNDLIQLIQYTPTTERSTSGRW